jgi:hypothetical protein
MSEQGAESNQAERLEGEAADALKAMAAAMLRDGAGSVPEWIGCSAEEVERAVAALLAEEEGSR